MFEQTLKLLPEPGPNQPYYTMFRRGANANLGRIYEIEKNPARAIAYYTHARSDPAICGEPAPCPRVGLARSDRRVRRDTLRCFWGHGQVTDGLGAGAMFG